MKKVFLILGFLFAFFPIMVKAYSCSSEQTERYKKLASQIHATYDYKELNNEIIFDITFHNVHSELYIADYDNFDYHVKYTAEKGIVLAKGYAPSNSYTFKILNKNSVCNTQIISNITVNLPFYNKYSNDPLCAGINEFSLCQKWSNPGSLTEREFKRSVQEYKKLKQESEQNSQILEEKNNWDKIRDFVAGYYIYIVAGILLITSVIIYVVNNNKKNKW